MSGDPPISNPPQNESMIRHYSTIFNPRSEFQEHYQEGPYRNNSPPVHPQPGNPQMSGDVRSYDPTHLPPNLDPKNFTRNRHHFSPNTVQRQIQDAINRYPQPKPRNRVPVPQPWHRLPVPYHSQGKPSSPSIPKAPVKSTERDPASILDLDSTYTIQGRHPVPGDISPSKIFLTLQTVIFHSFFRKMKMDSMLME